MGYLPLQIWIVEANTCNKAVFDSEFVTKRQHLVKLRALSHLTRGILRVCRTRVWDRPARFPLVDLQRGINRANR